jgi:methylated-DNA-[protein]-cysteine S-methyltransferase
MNDTEAAHTIDNFEATLARALSRRDPGSEQAARAALALTERAATEGRADITYATIDSPLGPLLLASSRRGLVRVAYPECNADDVLVALARQVSPRIVEARGSLDPVRRELDEYFCGQRHQFGLALDWALAGSYARRVLTATAAIPYGGVSSYRAIATLAGSPNGYRAAGNALGQNPLPIVVPCHRVLQVGGGLGGYAGGVERKRWLLSLEGAPSAGV